MTLQFPRPKHLEAGAVFAADAATYQSFRAHGGAEGQREVPQRDLMLSTRILRPCRSRSTGSLKMEDLTKKNWEIPERQKILGPPENESSKILE